MLIKTKSKKRETACVLIFNQQKTSKNDILRNLDWLYLTLNKVVTKYRNFLVGRFFWGPVWACLFFLKKKNISILVNAECRHFTLHKNTFKSNTPATVDQLPVSNLLLHSQCWIFKSTAEFIISILYVHKRSTSQSTLKGSFFLDLYAL